jgi:hypothetical protein
MIVVKFTPPTVRDCSSYWPNASAYAFDRPPLLAGTDDDRRRVVAEATVVEGELEERVVAVLRALRREV